MMDKLEKRLAPLGGLAECLVLRSLRDGLALVVPWVAALSLVVLVVNFPLPGWGAFWQGLLGAGWHDWAAVATHGALAVMGLATAAAIGASHGQNRGLRPAVGAIAGALALALLTVPRQVPQWDAAARVQGLGASGLFFGILVGFAASELVAWLTRHPWPRRLPAGVPPAVARSLAELVPGTVLVAGFGLVRLAADAWLPALARLVYTWLQAPLLAIADTMPAQLVYSGMSSLLWSLGINGPAVVNAVWSPLGLGLNLDNLQAFATGAALPHIYTQSFIDFFTTYGGGGSTLSLALVLLAVPHAGLRRTGRLALAPGIFGINEPLLFGLPIVMTPLLAVPFVLAPLVNVVVSGLAFSNGWVPRPNGVMLPWTTPPLVSGWLATGAWQGAALQLVEILIGVIIYYPFVRRLARRRAATEG
ncbi:PTS sugar transporter subunit IIC [Lacticaseibacillus kribbianus]|uniref:PTS sugar transporter subunit IIC n=1 Tax=Lacticaseibacillus kribbianus TaxID=2926292 RepID=UPI001CD67200|nr:PTS transporter subunit EIIC [Lacticaseibacillus kribbianus]